MKPVVQTFYVRFEHLVVMKRIPVVLLVFLLLSFSTVSASEDGNVPAAPVGLNDLSLELYAKKKLFDKKSYADLRKAYAHDFEKKHVDDLDRIWGDSDDPFRKFMDEHPRIKEIFFQVINPTGRGGDNIPAALRLMKEIWKKYPKEFETYPALAVAVSLVWDRPDRGTDAEPVMRQHKATEASGQADAMANFHYYSNVDISMGDRIRYMPWEFLALLVDQKTPLDERKWALKNYLPKRSGIGKVYGTVAYDYPMLAGTAEPKLAGIAYTLPNMLSRGGVCSCQADFSTRVAKSIGVPAFYVVGADRYGGLHAWVMWIEIHEISSKGMRCSLLSEGRYFKDNFYVGSTREPWSGLRTTDRALAMNLSAIGRDTIAYRQSVLALRAFNHIAAEKNLSAREKLDYLGKVLDLNPLSTVAWRRIAAMVRSGDFDKKDANLLKMYFNRFFRDFSQHPDFTWEVFDDLVSFSAWQRNRGKNYGKLCTLYEQAKRPDLACRARLKYGKILADEGKQGEALKGLAGTCLLFPDEGAIIPGIIEEMERLCRDEDMEKTKANYRSLASFYKALLPKIPKNRDNRPSKYCISMYEKASLAFETVGDTQAALVCREELRKLKSSSR